MGKIFLVTIIIFAVLLTLTPIGCKQKQPPDPKKTAAKAPNFTLTSYDSRKINLSDYKGKIIVLEWMNYDCPFCKHNYETAAMPQLAKKYEAKGIIWLAINSTHYATAEKNKEFAEKYKIDYPILSDKDGKVGRAYHAKTTPHMFIIDANNTIVYQGAIDDSPLGNEKPVPTNYVDKALTELLKGKPITIKETTSYGCSVKYAD